jgi:hypothetical protein
VKIETYMKRVESAVGRRLTPRETAVAGAYWMAKKGFRTAARDILRARNAT